jgi:uncharacterized membrane protein YcaP (DUF421 family)
METPGIYKTKNDELLENIKQLQHKQIQTTKIMQIISAFCFGFALFTLFFGSHVPHWMAWVTVAIWSGVTFVQQITIRSLYRIIHENTWKRR